MNPDKILSTVREVAISHDLKPEQVTILQRYFLHKLTKMSLNQIATETGTSTLHVYNSIRRVETGKRFDWVKSLVYARI